MSVWSQRTPRRRCSDHKAIASCQGAVSRQKLPGPRIASGGALLRSLRGLAFTCALALGAERLLASGVEFNRDIRPILSDRCFACHGPDQGQRKAGLRLDREEGALTRLKSGHTALVPGKPGESELLRRITATDPGERMPPASSGKEVTAREVDLIKKWIEGGGRWQGHWAYQPLAAPPLPEGADRFGSSPIDAFVRARLEREGLPPAPRADPVTLARRLSLDLTGLPPASGAEATRLERDPSPEAYARLVDELLASPAFGERLAVWWLDLARYADTVGYHGDQDQSVWPYRDYVIRSFNENKPLDRFTLEQIAGDLLEGATVETRVAAGYNRLAMKSAEGGVQDREYLAKYAAERVRAVSGAWLGATLGCAECHDHKFDPYTTRDFYRFAAFWADVTEQGIYSGSESTGLWGPSLEVPRDEDRKHLAELDQALEVARRNVEATPPELAAEQSAWEQRFPQLDWKVLRPTSAASTGGATLTVKEDGSVLAGGKNPEADVTTVTAAGDGGPIRAFRLEVLPDPGLPQNGPGRAGNGNFVLTEIEVRWQPAGGDVVRDLALGTATASFEQTILAENNPYRRWTVEAAIDHDVKGPSAGWAILGGKGAAQEAVFTLAADPPSGAGTLTFTLRQAHGNGGHNLGRFRLSATASTGPVRAAEPGVPADVRESLAVAASRRTPEQAALIAKHFRSIAPCLEPARKRLAELTAERDSTTQKIPRTLTTVARAPRPMRVLRRGNWMDDSGEVVTPGVPAFLPQPAGAPATLSRVDLARWLVSRDNPVTARHFANQLWRLLFGAGLSRKMEDLGSQGEWPAQAELLDWLAARLRDSGWDVKAFIREVVLSETYRQSSRGSPAAEEKDPFNRLLARQGRFRLDAEMVRDTILSVSGLLSRRVGGPSAKPYQPAGYWAYLNFPMREYQADKGENQYRRGLYTHWQRQYLHPSLAAFDAPTREECTADRPRSSTPLQALVLLNDPTYVEAARVFAVRIAREGGQDEVSRVSWALRTALSRAPREAEVSVLRDLYRRHLEEYRKDPEAARALTTLGLAQTPGNLPVEELAAWTSVARAIFNLHELITRS